MQKDTENQPWWHPDSFTRKIPYLQERARILGEVRAFFNSRGYLEVETPALQASPCMEAHIQAFKTELVSADRNERHGMYLHTSPEFAMKKLLVAGLPKIYQFAKVFRNAERATWHSPEFTMLEWYQTGMSYREMMQETVDLVRAVAKGKICRSGKLCDPHQPWEIITVVDALKKYAGVDISGHIPCHSERSEESHSVYKKKGDPSPSAQDDCSLEFLKSEAKRIGVYISPQDDWENALLKIIMEKVEPKIGAPVPTILCDYPVSMAALSRPKPEDARFAERFEVYICGIELANAFGELTDAKVQHERFLHDVALRRMIYGDDYPVDDDFIRALELGLKPCSGNALGLDRLIMLLTAADTIDLVQAAPVQSSGKDGWTALHYAAAAEAQGIEVGKTVEMLLEAGADPHQPDAKGDTAFNIAAPASPVAGRLMTNYWLEQAMAGKGPKGLNDRSGSHGSTLAQYIAKWSSDDEIEGQIKAAVAKGMKIDVLNSSGWTPLSAAAAMGRVHAVEVFARFYSPAAIRAKTTESYTARYGGAVVTYPAGIDAAGIAKARLEQDKNLSPAMKDDLQRCIKILH